MEPISRRTALKLGGVGAGLVLVGGGAIVWSQVSAPKPSASPSPSTPTAAASSELEQPPVLRSVDGQLDVTLVAAESTVTIGGIAVGALTYSQGLPGPTLVVRGGDVVSITLDNQLPSPTNLHTHGLHVSPDGSSDNVFRQIDPGTAADYRYEIPADHPPGVYWYHPHHHGMAAEQVFGGLYGAIIVEDSTPLDVTTERVLVISDMTFDANGTIAGASQRDVMNGREGTTILLNGQVAATMTASPGDRERWRIVNACASRYLDLTLDGQSLLLLGNDSGRFDEAQEVEHLVLMPGNRADVVVTMASGSSVLKVIPVDRGSAGGMGGGGASAATVMELATVVVSGVGSQSAPLSLSGPAARDLRNEPITGQRTLTLAMGGGGGGMGGGMQFTIDGKSFDAGRVDQAVAYGGVEQWTIVNTSTMDHPFHLHVWPMQVISIGPVATSVVTWQDVVNVPAGSSTVVRVAFEDYPGTAVYHCHILDHEDSGMMGVIAVA
jgi:FtsP/CotA-like multicopper oxidase with cupredoxin domain